MEETKKTGVIKDFLIKTLNGMAYGLFSTLIVGTIISTIASFIPQDNVAYTIIYGISQILMKLTGAGIALGVGLSLKVDGLKLVSLMVVGEIAAFCNNGLFNIQIGDPLTVYLVVIATYLIVKLVLVKKTPVDIILIPLFSVVVGSLFSLALFFPIGYITKGIATFIGIATNFQPILMGIVISAVMGMALTAPISSAAIAASVFILPPEATEEVINGLNLASGAAIVGCSTQMIGFMIQSRKDNNLGTIISIGIGTSMLQFKNILVKPIIWLPTIITSMILGPIATTVLHTSCMGSAAGMGTSGLVGQIGTFASMGNTWQTWVSIFVLEIVAPLILVFVIDLIFRKFNLIKEGDLKI